METADAKVCRLCFTSQTQLLNILDGLNSHFVDIITEHIGEVKIINIRCSRMEIAYHCLFVDLFSLGKSIRCIAEMHLCQLLGKMQ